MPVQLRSPVQTAAQWPSCSLQPPSFWPSPAQLAADASAADWQALAAGFEAAEDRRRLPYLLRSETFDVTLAGHSIRALQTALAAPTGPAATAATAKDLFAAYRANLGLALLAAGDEPGVAIWLALVGPGLQQLLSTHGEIVAQAARQPKLLAALLAPLTAEQRAHIVLAEGRSIFLPLAKQIDHDPAVVRQICSLADEVLTHVSYEPGRRLIHEARCLLTLFRAGPELADLARRLRRAVGLEQGPMA